jgi:PGF-pre-PGF domain-containing protein
VTLSNDAATGNVTVTDHSSPPADVSAPAGSTLATVEITVPDAERDTSATVELDVPAEAVTDPGRLTVERYVPESETWMELETTVTDTTDTTITVTAETPGFSLFAVTEPAEESTPPATDGTDGTDGTDDGKDASETNTLTPTPNGSNSGVITPSEKETPPDDPNDLPGFGIIPAVTAVLLAVGGSAIFGSRVFGE